MKILTVCYEFPPLGGGGAKVVQGLTQGLILAGHEVDVITMSFSGLPREETVNGVRVYRVPCLRLNPSVCYFFEMVPFVFLAIPLIFKLVKKNHYVLNHTHFIFPDGFISWVIHKLTGLPYMITAHGSDVPGYNPDRFKLLHFFLSPLWYAVVRNAKVITSPSQYIANLIYKHCKELEVKVIPNGINTDKFDPQVKKEDKILVVTRMFERKGTQFFLKTLKGLEHSFEINIVGDGPYLKKLKKIAKREKVKVNFLGFLDNKGSELKKLFETSKIFVFTSEAENFPIVLLEAMTAGMAIITAEGSGCTEVVGSAALLVPPKDPEALRAALQKLIASPEECHALGQKARERLEAHFGWTSVVRQYNQAYQQFK